MRSTLSFACLCTALLVSGCAAHRAGAAPGPAPVVVADTARAILPGDYLRVIFIWPGTKIPSLSKPGALRAFATATVLYSPPLKLAELPYYSGLANIDDRVLVAMRCRPPHPETVDAVLATWPNVFLAIQRDVPLQPGSCSAHPAETATQMACFARDFSDPPAENVSSSLAHTFNYAETLYDGRHKALADWLQANYGIYPAFAGTGYSVKDSYSLSASHPMTAQQVLVKSVSSEYILKNVLLGEAGCRCISVAPYPGRSNDPLDPSFISQAGGDGVCRPVDRLVIGRRR